MHIPFFSKKTSKPRINKANNKPTFYPVCPKCLNPHLKPVSEFTSGWLTTPRYYCPFCHYSGTIIMEIDVTLLETKSPQELREMFLEAEKEEIKEERNAVNIYKEN